MFLQEPHGLHEIYDYLKPWHCGGPGLILTYPQCTIPPDLDQFSPAHGIPEASDWVLCYDFTDAGGSYVELLKWALDHVKPSGYIMVTLPYPRYSPKSIRQFIFEQWGTKQLVLDELPISARSMVIIRNSEPTYRTMHIEGRSEVGDTMSLAPVIQAMQSEHPGIEVYVSEDKHGLLSEFGVKVSEEPPDRCDAVMHLTARWHETADYYRRSDDFHYYPIRSAKSFGWLKGEYPKQPGILQITTTLRPRLQAQLDYLGDYVVVAPESNSVARMWRFERWDRLITWLLENGERVVLVGRHPEYHQYNPGKLHNSCLNLVGKTDVHELGAVIARAKYTISCDSSPAHIAAGHGVPSIILEGPTKGVFRSPLAHPIARKDGGCMNCLNDVDGKEPYIEGQQNCTFHCGYRKQKPCMDKISVTQVMDTVIQKHGHTPQKPGLSICIMTKNEEVLIKDCLDTAVKAADEVILVDTGSVDSTVGLARSYGSKVKIFENVTVGFEKGFIADFSAVRNFAFSKATQKYVMWMDAGDRISDPEILREEVLAERSDVLLMGTIFGRSRYKRERVGPRGMVKFEHRVHETMNIDGLSTECSAAHIMHLGSKKVGREQSLDRNIRLLLRMLDEDPKSRHRWRWYFYLGQDLLSSGRTEEAMEYFKKVKNGRGFWEERVIASLEIAKSLITSRAYDAAMSVCLDALKLGSNWREPLYMIGDIYFRQMAYEKAIPWYTHCLGVPRPEVLLWLWEDVYTWLPQSQLSYCYESLGSLDEALYWLNEEKKNVSKSQEDRIHKRQRTLEEAKHSLGINRRTCAKN